MKRRTLLKQLAMATTAAVLLPACIADPKKVSIALNNLDVNGDEEDLMASIAETLIPVTDKPGAVTVGAHLFTFVMVDDCMDKPTKEKFLSGLRSFENTCKQAKGKTFTKSTPEERVALLKYMQENNKNLSEDIQTFYATSRRFIIQGYLSSQYYLTEVKPYVHVPGPDFRGCVPVSENPQNV
jgi:hypothetical protein